MVARVLQRWGCRQFYSAAHRLGCIRAGLLAHPRRQIGSKRTLNTPRWDRPRVISWGTQFADAVSWGGAGVAACTPRITAHGVTKQAVRWVPGWAELSSFWYTLALMPVWPRYICNPAKHFLIFQLWAWTNHQLLQSRYPRLESYDLNASEASQPMLEEDEEDEEDGESAAGVRSGGGAPQTQAPRTPRV